MLEALFLRQPLYVVTSQSSFEGVDDGSGGSVGSGSGSSSGSSAGSSGSS